MKKLSILGLITLIMCFASCKKDDDPSSRDNSHFYEITVNDRVFKSDNDNSLIFMGITPIYSLENLTTTLILPTIIKTADYEIECIRIVHYKDPESFDKYNKIGTYKMRGEYSLDWDDNGDFFMDCENFDLSIDIRGNEGEYIFQSGSHNITDVKTTNVDKDSGDKEYLISGNFSGVYKNSTTYDELKISGKYRTFAMTLAW